MKKYDLLKLKNNKLLVENKRLKHCLNDFKSELIIRRQHCLSLKCALDLSQKLINHLKTENSLLKTSRQLVSIPVENSIDININNSVIISDNQINETIVNENHIKFNDNSSLNNNSIDNNLCKSDLIAIQYENEIKEWTEECDLLSDVPILNVVVNCEEQLMAKKFVSDESEDEMDVEFEDKSSDKMNDSSNDTENNTKIKCKTCAKKFSSESLLEEHKSHHKSDDNRIKCAEDNCSFKCDSRHDLKDHIIKIHRNKTETSKQITNKSELKSKVNSTPVSSNKRLFECKECKKQLSSMQSLRQHQRSVHNMISWFKCKFSGCLEKFDKSIDLRVHEELHRKQRLESGQQIKQIVSTDSKHSLSTFQFELNPNPTEAKTETQIFSQYFTPINNDKSIQSDSNSPEVFTSSQQSVPKTVYLFKCEYDGCNSGYKQKSSLRRHIEKYHKRNTSGTNQIDLQSNGSNEDKPIDIHKQQLQMLALLYEDQRKHIMM